MFPDSSEMKLDEIIRKIVSTYKEKRPPFEEIRKMLGLKDINDVLHPSGRFKGIIASIPVDVEEHCERVSFNLVYPQSNKLWLYLVDPRGRFVDMSSPHEAEKAIRLLNGSDLQGRALKVNIARPREKRPAGGGWYTDQVTPRNRRKGSSRPKSA